MGLGIRLNKAEGCEQKRCEGLDKRYGDRPRCCPGAACWCDKGCSGVSGAVGYTRPGNYRSAPICGETAVMTARSPLSEAPWPLLARYRTRYCYLIAGPSTALQTKFLAIASYLLITTVTR